MDIRVRITGLLLMIFDEFVYVNFPLRLLMPCVAVTHRLSHSGNNDEYSAKGAIRRITESFNHARIVAREKGQEGCDLHPRGRDRIRDDCMVRLPGLGSFRNIAVAFRLHWRLLDKLLLTRWYSGMAGGVLAISIEASWQYRGAFREILEK